MAISHWVHINTYLSLAVIVTILIAAIVFSVRRNADETPDRTQESADRALVAQPSGKG
jgi:predicted tellurium resistance membrane protein TerC